MILISVLLLYLLGAIMLHQQLKLQNNLTVLDVVLFIFSPFNIVIVLAIKVASHFYDINDVVYTQKDDNYI